MAHFDGTAVVATPLVFVIEGSPVKVPSVWQTRSIQVDATGAGSLQVDTKMIGQAAFNTQTTITAGTVIIDCVGVSEIQITASGSDVPFAIDTYGIR